ncbi:MAG: hypothetical protein EXX96DRAFT_564163 [Benjaminiella poitrasii]|nr:MAG: hypothetical protein EXX96DRAFT_564163 [Benjaminiella poitrasii]
MHPLVHSSTHTSLKSKWNTFKTWIIPDLNKRRPSDCSTISSTCCCCQQKQHHIIVVTNHDARPLKLNTQQREEREEDEEEDGLVPTTSYLFQKRPSLTGSISEGLVGSMMDKCMSPFRRRPSNASSTSIQEAIKEQQLEKVYELYSLAMDEINYAEDSRGSRYYDGDRIAAKEAIDQCEEAYSSLLLLLLSHNHETYLLHLQATIGFKIADLKSRYTLLPLQDNDQLSF